MKRRIKVVRLRDYSLTAEMHYLERDIFEVSVSDEVAVVKQSVLFADSFRHARSAFTNWIHQSYPKQNP